MEKFLFQFFHCRFHGRFPEIFFPIAEIFDNFEILEEIKFNNFAKVNSLSSPLIKWNKSRLLLTKICNSSTTYCYIFFRIFSRRILIHFPFIEILMKWDNFQIVRMLHLFQITKLVFYVFVLVKQLHEIFWKKILFVLII